MAMKPAAKRPRASPMAYGGKVADSPDAYVSALKGWQRATVTALREAVRAAAPLDERIKWTHIVAFSNGPVLLIRAEEIRVLFGFWRGKRLAAIEPRLKGGGKFELATMEFHRGDAVDPAIVTKLVREAVKLNRTLGDPTAKT